MVQKTRPPASNLSLFVAAYPAGLLQNHNLCLAQQMTVQSHSCSYCINIQVSLREEKVAKIKARHVVLRSHTTFLIAISFVLSSVLLPSGASLGSYLANRNNLCRQSFNRLCCLQTKQIFVCSGLAGKNGSYMLSLSYLCSNPTSKVITTKTQ